MDYLDDKEEPKLSMQRKSKIASIICVSFNQDKSWLACGTTLGFRVYDTQNMKMIDSNEGKNFSLNSGVCSISLLSKTILVSIVTDGLNAHHPNTIVYLWDKYTKEVKKEFKHTGKVETTYLIPKKLFTLSQNTIFVWDLETASIKELISTSSDLTTFFVNSLNKSSIALVHQNDKKRIVVVFPCINVIEISITNISAKVETIIKPEVPEFQIITLSDDLSYLALVDTTGIYVYVYDANSGKLVFEFIRGKTSCKVTWIQFSEDNQFLMMMNEKGTLHIFKLDERNRTRDGQENEGIFSTMALFVPKLFSKPSGFCRYHPNPEKLTGISWVDSLRGRVHGPFFNVQKDDNIKVFFVSGMYNTIKFNKNEGGECHEIPEASGKIWFDPFENEETPAEEEDDDEYIII